MVSNENFKGKSWAGQGHKKTPPEGGVPKPMFLKPPLFAPSPLGRLDRVDLGLLLGRIGLDVGGQIADPVSPFQGRFRRGTAIGRRVVAHDPVAPIALLNNGMATPAAKPAALFFHERTFVPFSNGCANH
jgi:hypothetical protein